MVVELPAVYAVSCAQRFAQGGVSIAKSFGDVDKLAFGCEADSLEALTAAANAIDNFDVNSRVTEKMSAGAYYPQAFESAVREVLGGHVSPDATLCTDEDASYRRFSKDNGNGLVQIKGGKKTVKGIYHIQHLNAYHSKLKLFLAGFKGVSSKYLNNYLTWNNVVEHKTGTLREKVARMMRYVASTMFEEACTSIPLRPSLPILVKNQS